MIEILSITSPIFLMICLGYITTKKGLFTKADMRIFGKFVLYLALPALLFNSISQKQFSELINPTYLLAYALGTLSLIAVSFFTFHRALSRSVTQSAVYTMGVSCSNSSFVGYPILILALPSIADQAFALNLIVENLCIIPILLTLAERGRPQSVPISGWQLVKENCLRLLKNPLIIALVAGLIASLLEIKFPKAISKTITMVAMSSGALSLFVIGGALVGIQMKGLTQKILPVMSGKLLLHPLFILAALLILPALGLPKLSLPLSEAAVMFAAMPMMGIFPVLGQLYHEEEFCSAALLATTAVSFITLNILLWLLHNLHVA